jgi:hypothetical protein
MMKLPSMLRAALLVVGASMYFNALSAESEGAATADAKSGQTAQAAKPHSHMDEKLGHTSQSAPTTKKKNPSSDTSKHYHPRDK